jgi:hypothetical protein
VALDIARPLVGIALSAPPVTMAQATALGALIERDLPDLMLPRPRADLVEETRDDPPVPTLVLANRQRRRNYWEEWGKDWDERVDVALLGYAYGGMLIDADGSLREQRRVEDGRIVIRRRDLDAERSAQGIGWRRSGGAASGLPRGRHPGRGDAVPDHPVPAVLPYPIAAVVAAYLVHPHRPARPHLQRLLQPQWRAAGRLRARPVLRRLVFHHPGPVAAPPVSWTAVCGVLVGLYVSARCHDRCRPRFTTRRPMVAISAAGTTKWADRYATTAPLFASLWVTSR